VFARLPSVLVLVVMALLPAPLWSAEEILRFDSEIEVAADATMLVTERITVRAEGKLIRRGIYRDFPTDYRDALGNRYIVGFSVVAVARDGYSEASLQSPTRMVCAFILVTAIATWTRAFTSMKLPTRPRGSSVFLQLTMSSTGT
jgi:hypothetical protein